jgi:GntR family transcriptional regulator
METIKLKLIINNSLMVPIYEQIVDQIKTLIQNGELKENDNLPSVRTLSKELNISALTVKKAYDHLETEGFTITVHGKGTYVAASSTKLLLEEQKKEVEANLEKAILMGRKCGLDDKEIRTLFDLIMVE